MKIIHTAFLILFTFTLSAQIPEKFTEGTMRIGDDLYEIGITTRYNRVVIANISKNIEPDRPTRENPEPYKIMPSDIHFSTDTVKQIIFEVLSEKLKSLKELKEFISVLYGFNSEGKAVNLVFSLLDTTIVSPCEIALIDDRLRKELTATFTDDHYKTQKVIFGGRQPFIFF